jgi:DNA-binding MarR family transcriptional regulator
MTKKPKRELVHELVEVTRASQVATDKMDDAGSRALGVNRTDGRCLDVIQQSGRISAGELAERAGLTSGSITAVIDRLEEKGYVRRVADPEDRRRVLLELTEQMERRAWELWGPLAQRGVPHLERLSTSEIELLIRYMRFATELNEIRAAEIRAELR